MSRNFEHFPWWSDISELRRSSTEFDRSFDFIISTRTSSISDFNWPIVFIYSTFIIFMTQRVSRRIWSHGDVRIKGWKIPEGDQQVQFYDFVFLLNNFLLLHLILFRFRSELFELITKTREPSDEIRFYFRFLCFQLPVCKKLSTSGLRWKTHLSKTDQSSHLN